jgi:beta-phosphoglucomutase-like phosphatase (HAD superfamily)
MKFEAPRPFDRTVLSRVLEAASRHGERGIVVFDLDSTLFDNRPRQVRILREFGAARGIPELAASTLEHWTSSWLLREAMIAAGLEPGRADDLFADFEAFWKPRFFHSDYCVEDAPLPGAVEFVREVHRTGARIVYCTGRHETMRPGTVRSLERCGFPCPPLERTQLWMKPGDHVVDDEFKRDIRAALAAEGRVVALFDNEPTHINGYHAAFPEALAVHLATDHSGRPVEVLPTIPAIPDFLFPESAARISGG